jgi:hypothetical protein
MNSKLPLKKLDRILYVIIEESGDEPYVTETPVSRMGLVNVLRDIRQGQYGEILHIIEINPIHHLCREATDDEGFVQAMDDIREARAEAQRRQG